MEPSVWLIAGPTASGKSTLALRLAQAIGGEVVNADSMQLYADMAMLTARPTAREVALAPHHLYGAVDAAEAWSVGRWLTAAQRVLREIGDRGRPAVVVGGTGLYFRALTEGLADIPAAPQALRDAASHSFDTDGEEAFRAKLAEQDPLSAARISPGDRQRLVRAWSVVEASGVPLPAWQSGTRPALSPGTWAAAVLEPPRAALYARCELRLQAMIAGGALEEVAALLARGLPPDLPAMKALGVRELADALQGRCSLEAAVAAAQMQTRRYAKRQSTWFRNQTPDWPRIVQTDPESPWDGLWDLVRARRA